MTIRHLLLLAIGDFCLNVMLIWLVAWWQVRRQALAYRSLCREAQRLCEEVSKIAEGRRGAAVVAPLSLGQMNCG